MGASLCRETEYNQENEFKPIEIIKNIINLGSNKNNEYVNMLKKEKIISNIIYVLVEDLICKEEYDHLINKRPKDDYVINGHDHNKLFDKNKKIKRIKIVEKIEILKVKGIQDKIDNADVENVNIFNTEEDYDWDGLSKKYENLEINFSTLNDLIIQKSITRSLNNKMLLNIDSPENLGEGKILRSYFISPHTKLLVEKKVIVKIISENLYNLSNAKMNIENRIENKKIIILRYKQKTKNILNDLTAYQSKIINKNCFINLVKKELDLYTGTDADDVSFNLPSESNNILTETDNLNTQKIIKYSNNDYKINSFRSAYGSKKDNKFNINPLLDCYEFNGISPKDNNKKIIECKNSNMTDDHFQFKYDNSLCYTEVNLLDFDSFQDLEIDEKKDLTEFDAISEILDKSNDDICKVKFVPLNRQTSGEKNCKNINEAIENYNYILKEVSIDISEINKKESILDRNISYDNVQKFDKYFNKILDSKKEIFDEERNDRLKNDKHKINENIIERNFENNNLHYFNAPTKLVYRTKQPLLRMAIDMNSLDINKNLKRLIKLNPNKKVVLHEKIVASALPRKGLYKYISNEPPIYMRNIEKEEAIVASKKTSRNVRVICLIQNEYKNLPAEFYKNNKSSRQESKKFIIRPSIKVVNLYEKNISSSIAISKYNNSILSQIKNEKSNRKLLKKPIFEEDPPLFCKEITEIILIANIKILIKPLLINEPPLIKKNSAIVNKSRIEKPIFEDENYMVKHIKPDIYAKANFKNIIIKKFIRNESILYIKETNEILPFAKSRLWKPVINDNIEYGIDVNELSSVSKKILIKPKFVNEIELLKTHSEIITNIRSIYNRSEYKINNIKNTVAITKIPKKIRKIKYRPKTHNLLVIEKTEKIAVPKILKENNSNIIKLKKIPITQILDYHYTNCNKAEYMNRIESHSSLDSKSKSVTKERVIMNFNMNKIKETPIKITRVAISSSPVKELISNNDKTLIEKDKLKNDDFKSNKNNINGIHIKENFSLG